MRKILLPLILFLTACSANPLKEAKTNEQKAFALYGTFVVAEEVAAKLVLEPSVPAGVKEALRRADKVAKPAADTLLAGAIQVIEVRRELAQGKTTDEKLLIASTNLAMWYVEARPKILALKEVVEGVE